MKRRTLSLSAVFLSLAFLLAACSGGGGGTTATGGGAASVSALLAPDKVSVVDANVSGVGGAGVRSMALPSTLLGTDYANDKTQVWVSERSLEVFENVSGILCMVAQTKYDVMVNKGPYVALVDENLCKTSGETEGSGQQNQSSGSGMPNYMLWTVNSERASETSDQILTAWVHEPGHEDQGPRVIEAKLVITEGVSETNPLGQFEINFTDNESNGGDGPMEGFLRTNVVDGEVVLEYAESNPRWEETSQATLRRDAAGTGKGFVNSVGNHGWGLQTKTFQFAYDPDYFRRDDGIGNDICLDRNDFDESAWRYALYTAAGDRVVRNSGFPITTFDGDYGYVGYWGLWVNNNALIVNSDTVYKKDYSTGAVTPYTVFMSGGKLQKHTRAEMKLDEIKNIPLNYWDNQSGNQYRTIWNGTAFFQTALTNGTMNWTWQDLTPPVVVDITHVPYSDLNFWSDSLQGSVQVKLMDCTYNNNGTTGPGDWFDDFNNCLPQDGAVTNVVTYSQQLVYPEDNTVPDTLACFDQCLGAGDTGVSNTTPYLPPAQDPSFAGYNYTYDPGSMTLSYLGNAVVLDEISPMNEWGVRTGALFNATAANLALLDCNWDNDGDPATQPQTCAWKAWSVLPEYYTWETGINNWNKFTGLLDAQMAFVQFEAPLAVKYVHNAGKYNGSTFLLQYGGFGELQGIPGKCVNMNDGTDADCSQGGEGIRWVPEFTIPNLQLDGNITEVTDDANNTYLVKALEKEQRMKRATPTTTYCPDTTHGLPVDYELPAMVFTDPLIGTEPVVTDAPAVIGGILQITE